MSAFVVDRVSDLHRVVHARAYEPRPVYVVVVIGMVFDPGLRGMDIRQEPVSEPADARAAVQDGETLSASRRTDIR
jgi:hypothetical protein